MSSEMNYVASDFLKSYQLESSMNELKEAKAWLGLKWLWGNGNCSEAKNSMK